MVSQPTECADFSFSYPAQPDGLENSSLWLGSINIKLEVLGSARLQQIKL
jgi:hypothetical protein